MITVVTGAAGDVGALDVDHLAAAHPEERHGGHYLEERQGSFSSPHR